MSIPPQLLEQVCRMVNEKLGHTIPFSSRGITINRDLIETALVVLNSSPEKTLPQNSGMISDPERLIDVFSHWLGLCDQVGCSGKKDRK